MWQAETLREREMQTHAHTHAHNHKRTHAHTRTPHLQGSVVVAVAELGEGDGKWAPRGVEGLLHDLASVTATHAHTRCT